MRRNSILLAVIFIMFLFIVFLFYANNELDNQIVERDNIIRKMQVRESIIDSLLLPVQTDTTSVIYFFRDDKGKIISYHQLDSLCLYYEKQNALQDFVILTAKQRYNFDYSIKQENNKMTIKIWDKKYTKINNSLDVGY